MGRRGQVVSALAAVVMLVMAHGVTGVQITALRVPTAVRNGSASAVLDCEYSLRAEEAKGEAGLVVKWYFNNGPSPVYQWIPGGKPQDLGVLRGRLDLRHRATDHRATMHRALYIVRPTTDLSGEYKCHVSTFLDEDFMTKKMVIFVVGEDLQMWGSPQGDSLNVSCRGRGYFPEPKMGLVIDDTPLDSASVSSTRLGDVFDVTVSALLPPRGPMEPGPEADVDAEDRPEAGMGPVDPGPALVSCHIKIPGTEFSLRKSFVYYKGQKIPTNDSGTGPPWCRPPAALLGALSLHLLLLLLLAPSSLNPRRPPSAFTALAAAAAGAAAVPTPSVTTTGVVSVASSDIKS